MTDLPEEGGGGGEPKEGAGEVRSPDSPKAERTVKKPLLTPSRIVLLVLVIVAALAFTFEFRALSAYNRTVEDLSRAWESAEQTGKGMYRADLEKVVHGSPSKERDAATGIETFTWRGIRAHRLQVQYGSADFVDSFRTLGRGE